MMKLENSGTHGSCEYVVEQVVYRICSSPQIICAYIYAHRKSFSEIAILQNVRIFMHDDSAHVWTRQLWPHEYDEI